MVPRLVAEATIGDGELLERSNRRASNQARGMLIMNVIPRSGEKYSAARPLPGTTPALPLIQCTCRPTGTRGKLQMNKLNTPLALSALAFVAGVAPAHLEAQEKPYTPEKALPPGTPQAAEAKTPSAAMSAAPAPAATNSFLNGLLPEAITKGKFSLNVRPRWEHAHQTGLRESDAFTIRTRFGYTSAPLYGFQAMVEGENVAAIGSEDNFNAAGSNPGGAGRTVIADPPTTELNQAWLSYTNWNTLARGGRQRIILDNHRFIGDVGWRQNMQTYDAALIENKSLPYTTMRYGYIWNVNRVFGDVDNLPVANTDFESDSHFLHFAYEHWKWLKITAYTYLLDLDNGVVTQPNSTATYGGFLNGTVPVHEKVNLDYRAEFAWQTDHADNAFDYATEYYNLELGATIKPVNFGAGYEVLGSDNLQGFKTPLATLHAFNGWADLFLNTPGTGLRDIYAFAGVTLPYEIPFRVVWHDFRSDTASLHYGQEIDAVISKKFGKHWTVLAKYAYFDGKEAPTAVDVDKFWLQVEFNY